MPVAASMPEAPPASLPPGVERLFADHHEGVFQTAYRVTGNAADAEDVLQTVFLRLLARQEDVDLSPSPAGYLRRAAVNAALDAVRARGARPLVALELVAPERVASREPGPDRLHEDRELRDDLRRVLAGLHPRTAEIFVLKYLEGRSNVEIARTVGTSPGVVAVTLFRARGQVRRSLRMERKSQS